MQYQDILAAALSNGKTPQDLVNLDPQFASSLGALLAAAPQGAIQINSAYRSPERQQELYAAALKKYGSEQEARRWVAPPGKSQHNHGHAVDLGFKDDAARQWAHDNAPNFGLNFPLGHEPWHLELASARSSPNTDMIPVASRAPQLPAGLSAPSIPTPEPQTDVASLDNGGMAASLGRMLAQGQLDGVMPQQKPRTWRVGTASQLV